MVSDLPNRRGRAQKYCANFGRINSQRYAVLSTYANPPVIRFENVYTLVVMSCNSPILDII